MAKLTTKETKGGAQQYTRGGGKDEKSKLRIALDVTQDERPGRDESTTMSKEIAAAQIDPKLKKQFIKKYGLTPNKAEAMMSAAFAGADNKGSNKLEKFYQNRIKEEPKVKNKLGNKTNSMADRPRKGSDEPITKRNKGGLIKTGAKDYRKGGMFY